MRWLLVTTVAALAACESSATPPLPPPPPPAPVAAPVRGTGPTGPDTNIFATDYIGPNACGECHAANFAKWAGSLHRVMNALVTDPGAVIGDFSGVTISYAGGTATFSHDATGYALVLHKGATTRRYVVTRTIGRRGLQEYVGREAGTGDEVRLPFAWWPRAGGWFAQPSFDPWLGDGSHFDAYAPITEAWATRCPWCHSTYPFAQRIARDLGNGLDQFYQGDPDATSPRERLDVASQVTTGISCESCHLGARAHAAGAPIHFVPRGATPRPGAPVGSTFTAERQDAAIVNTVCAQCHSGPSPRLADGTALRNSSEALDLAASPCTGIRCTDCHEPHGANARAADTETRAVAACTRCHAALAEPAAARAHAGHPDGATTCLDCHMPRLVLGIDRHVRTHRIGSPTDARLYAAGAPDACNLCHLDRSTRWTVDALRDHWDVRLRVPAGDAPAGDTYLASPEPAYRLIAAAAFVRRPDLLPAALPAITRGADDPLLYVRAWTHMILADRPR